MLLKRKRGWEIPESEATPEHVYRNRREILAGFVASGLLVASGGLKAGAARAATEAEKTAGGLYPVARNPKYTLSRKITPEEIATTYNNFYEFGSHKEISVAAQSLQTDGWTVKIDGLVEEEKTVSFDELVRAMPLEERLYRHRCVEAWSMAVPYSGFPLKALVDYARPQGSARYLRMETFQDDEVAPGQRQFWYPWPYVEGLTMAEATSELAFIATGLYGKEIPPQNGAPLRLAVPWKYGFKHVKSIVRFTFTEERPVSFWEEINAKEYGFWANVNPKIAHPRWSQATERLLISGERVPTRLFNGYAEFVADLYKGMDIGDALYR